MTQLTDQAHRARTAEWVLNTVGKALMSVVAGILAALVLAPVLDDEWALALMILIGPLAAGLVCVFAVAPDSLTPDSADKVDGSLPTD